MNRSFLVVVVGFMSPILRLSFSSVAARALRLTLQPWEVRTADEFDRVFAATDTQAGLGF